VFRVMQEPTTRDREILREFGRREGFEIHLQTGGLDSVRPLDAVPSALSFSPDGSALAVRYKPTDFIQINDAVNQKMVRQALDWLAIEPGDAVLELFSGLGNFSLPLARAGARVTAVEGEAGLVQRARENAVRNGLDIRYERADLFQPDPHVDWLTARYAAVLLDPPRAGAREILPFVAERRPARILYVSCHPGTLARDGGFLVHERGYRLQQAGILDMFPHTVHVESMALFVMGDA
jgi:23S rRNA (uracil1939-C5)-methyltransferase